MTDEEQGVTDVAGAGGCLIVVPCYNEQQRLPVDAFHRFAESGSGLRLLFVNDGSRDGTLAVLQQLAEQYPAVYAVLDQQPNAGKAEAVRQGMLRAIAEGAAFTGYWDADLATPLEAIPHLLKHLVETPHLQMVFGSRVRLLGRAIHRKPVRHYLGRIFATVASVVLDLAIYDTQCGAKIFRVTPELQSVMAETFLSRWVFDVEILARFVAMHRGDAAYMERVIFEYPLHQWNDVAGSRLTPMDFLTSFGELLRIRQKYLR